MITTIRNFVPITKENLPPLDNEELAALRNNEKIRCIKLYRNRINVGLKAAKAATDHEQANQAGEEFDWAKFGTVEAQYQEEIVRLQRAAQYDYQRIQDMQGLVSERNQQLQDDAGLRNDVRYYQQELEFANNERVALKEGLRSALSLIEVMRKHNL